MPELVLRLLVSMPRILKGVDLRFASHAFRGFEEQVVIALRIERRVEINQIDRLIRNVLAQHLQIR